MIYQFVCEHSSEFSVKKTCQVLDITRSAYGDWLKKPMTYRQTQDAKLVPLIEAIFKESDSSYGARRIKEEASTWYR